MIFRTSLCVRKWLTRRWQARLLRIAAEVAAVEAEAQRDDSEPRGRELAARHTTRRAKENRRAPRIEEASAAEMETANIAITARPPLPRCAL